MVKWNTLLIFHKYCFDEKLIKDDNIHIIFGLNNSGSMSAPLYTNKIYFKDINKDAINKFANSRSLFKDHAYSYFEISLHKIILEL